MTNDILTVMRSLQSRLDAKKHWLVAEYVEAFLNGDLKAGRYYEHSSLKQGTLRSFVDAVKYSEHDDVTRKIELCALAALHYRPGCHLVNQQASKR